MDDITLTNLQSNNHGPLASQLETAGLWIANGANVDGLVITGREFNGLSYGLTSRTAFSAALPRWTT